MDIQNSLDFSYAKLKSQINRQQQQTWQAGSVFVHGIIVSYAVQYNKTLIDWISGNSNSWCLGEQ
jgi:hypothetical protein